MIAIVNVSKQNNMVVFCNSKIPDSILQLSVGINFVFDKWADSRVVYDSGDSDDTSKKANYSYPAPTYSSYNHSTYYGSNYSGSSQSSYSGGGGVSHVAMGGCNCGGHAK